MNQPRFLLLAASLALLPLAAAPLKDAELQKAFAAEAEALAAPSLADIRTAEDWRQAAPKRREELFEMLGLSPRPAKTDLRPVVAGRIERADFVVEKLHFQSMPGLYVTANFYLPKKIERPVPTILYLCGHGPVKIDGVSYGNKVSYQHHGAWFARNGYACLVIDTVQMGEIEGIHHGTYREGMWWWNARGFTSAGVEAWNCIRALDYLETRPEVDAARFGATGRSGGGAYSWWITALDERIKASAPVAGITDLRDHLTDGMVEGHCDCMYFVNTYQWDYPMVSALAAPRALLIVNTDKDPIFPLDGVVRLHEKTARIYDLLGTPDKLGLLIAEGGHNDTQDLQVPVFRWFNRHLKGQDTLIEIAATNHFTPAELKVFDHLPGDQINTCIHDTFVPMASIQSAPPAVRASELRGLLREKVLRPPLDARMETAVETPILNKSGRKLALLELSGRIGVPSATVLVYPAEPPQSLVLAVVSAGRAGAFAEFLAREFSADVPARIAGPNESGEDFTAFRQFLSRHPGSLAAFQIERGPASSYPKQQEKEAIQLRRRLMLAGTTLDSVRAIDIQRAAEFLKKRHGKSVAVTARGPSAVNALLAAFMSTAINQLVLEAMPADPKLQPDYLNFLRLTSVDELKQLAREASISIQEQP